MAGVKLRVSFDTAPFRREVDKFVRKQIPFATSLAVNRTAEHVKDALKASLRSSFIIRSDWVEKGIQRTKATKANPTSEIGSRDGFMALHVTGGTKRKAGNLGGRSRSGGPKAGRSMAVPAVPGPIRGGRTTRTRPSRWPSRFGQRNKRKPFIIRTSSGAALVRRKGRGKRPTLQFLYFFKRTVKIRRRWPMQGIAFKAVGRHWEREMFRALEEALRTAK